MQPRNSCREICAATNSSLAACGKVQGLTFYGGDSMGFCERFVHALSSTDLRDDEFHHQTHALAASAIADASARQIGSLLHRVKFADTLGHQFEDRPENLAKLLRQWHLIVAEKGAARKWIRPQDVPTIGHLAPAMYARVAEASLAHYLDGKCPTCHGSKVGEDRRKCVKCDGSGDAKILGMSDFELGRTMDMVGELTALESSHSGAANALLRREI